MAKSGAEHNRCHLEVTERDANHGHETGRPTGHSLALGADYSHWAIAGGDARFAFDGHYQSRVIPAISASVPIAAGYTSWNTRASYTRSRWTGTWYLNNIADQRGISSYTDPSTYGARYSALVSQPSTIGFKLGYSLKGS